MTTPSRAKRKYLSDPKCPKNGSEGFRAIRCGGWSGTGINASLVEWPHPAYWLQVWRQREVIMYLQMKLRQYACADCGKLSAGMREAARGADGSDEAYINSIANGR